MKKPREEEARAAARLRGEREVPIGELAGRPVTINGVEMRPSAVVWMRWGCRGKNGVCLDVRWCQRRLAWVTSHEAVERFRRALAEQLRRRPVPAG